MDRKKRQRLTLETIRRIRKCFEKNMSAKEIADYVDLSLRATYNVMDKIQNNVLDEDMISSPKNKRKSSKN